MRRIDFRSLADCIVDTDDLVNPGVQSDHPTMQGISDLVFFNGLPDDAQEVLQRILSTGQNISIKDAYKATRDMKIEMDDLEELLFTGILDDTSYEHYLKMKEDKPGISARDYFNSLCLPYEKDPAVKKLAKIFEAVIDAKETQEEYIKPISKREFESNKDNGQWVQDNLKAIQKSRVNW